MNAREMERELKEAGFWLMKSGSKHHLWTNGKMIIPISYGGKGARSDHTLRAFKKNIRNAKKEMVQA